VYYEDQIIKKGANAWSFFFVALYLLSCGVCIVQFINGVFNIYALIVMLILFVIMIVSLLYVGLSNIINAKK